MAGHEMRLGGGQPPLDPGRPRDEIWDALVLIFGDVAPKTNAHGKRNKAVADLKRLGATMQTLRIAISAWPRHFEGATLTDTALATHYPQLVNQHVMTQLTDGETAAVEEARRIERERPKEEELVPMTQEAREALARLGVLKNMENS